MSDRIWVRIAKDPLGRNLVDAMSLGSEGTAFAGYAIDIPEDWFEQNPDAEKYFEVLDEDDVTEQEKTILLNNRSRNAAFLAEAKRNQQIRKQQRAAGRLQQQMAAMQAVMEADLTDDLPDSDDD